VDLCVGDAQSGKRVFMQRELAKHQTFVLVRLVRASAAVEMRSKDGQAITMNTAHHLDAGIADGL